MSRPGYTLISLLTTIEEMAYSKEKRVKPLPSPAVKCRLTGRMSQKSSAHGVHEPLVLRHRRARSVRGPSMSRSALCVGNAETALDRGARAPSTEQEQNGSMSTVARPAACKVSRVHILDGKVGCFLLAAAFKLIVFCSLNRPLRHRLPCL